MDQPMPPPARTIEVPERMLGTLLSSVAIATGHFMLAGDGPGVLTHPGDGFGRVLAWLWRTGQRDTAGMLTAGLLGQLRVHDPAAPDPGQRTTWTQLRRGIGVATSRRFDDDDTETDRMLAWLDQRVPGLYGAPLSELNTP